MVGVPGKYRGCETCRGRRVKCGNERPFCKRCVDSSRPCTYERETVFIVASIEDGGRCSSHPPRKTAKKSKSKSPSAKPQEEKMQFTAEEPLSPAWNDLITVSNNGRKYNLQIAALHTPLHTIVRGQGEVGGDDGQGRASSVGFSLYEVPEVRPSMSDDDFQLQAKALVHISKPQVEDDTQGIQVDGFFLFLFEHNNSLSFNIPPWRDPNPIRQQGPENFRTFPNHHFFVRVYRHNAIFAALLNRKSTFLSEPPWMTSPWELHAKSPLDLLLDAIVLIPALLQRADHIAAQEPTLARRLMAQDLLQNCLTIEGHLDQWHAGFAASYWVQPPSAAEQQQQAMLPFAETYAFADGLTALAFVYLWTAQLVFFPCVERLYWTIFEPVVDGPFAGGHAEGLVAAAVNPLRYGVEKGREAAGNVCRALDFALGRTVQPDMLAAPLHVVGQFFQMMVGGGDGGPQGYGDGRLELMWCEGFGVRLAARGREIQEVVQTQLWRDFERF